MISGFIFLLALLAVLAVVVWSTKCDQTNGAPHADCSGFAEARRARHQRRMNRFFGSRNPCKGHYVLVYLAIFVGPSTVGRYGATAAQRPGYGHLAWIATGPCEWPAPALRQQRPCKC